jgi:alpha-D-ribose 1-methylphosphonate 5-phosphate C-P lyase
VRAQETRQVLEEWLDTIDEGLDPALQAVSTALFLEETFGIVLTDAEIDCTVIGTLSGMLSVLARHCGSL